MNSEHKLLLQFSLVAVLLVVGCQQSNVQTAAARATDVKAIRNAETAWNHAYASKDLDNAISFYKDDATVLNPGMPAVIGKENIRAVMQKYFADKNFTLHFEAAKVEVAQSGDIGYSQGTAESTMTDPATGKVVNEKGKYLTVWQKQSNGGWRAIEDMYNTDQTVSSTSHKKVTHAKTVHKKPAHKKR
jgi:uncharacterized protein (TIGR02246 family)